MFCSYDLGQKYEYARVCIEEPEYFGAKMTVRILFKIKLKL